LQGLTTLKFWPQHEQIAITARGNEFRPGDNVRAAGGFFFISFRSGIFYSSTAIIGGNVGIKTASEGQPS